VRKRGRETRRENGREGKKKGGGEGERRERERQRARARKGGQRGGKILGTHKAATRDPGDPSEMLDKFVVGKHMRPVSGISSRGAFFCGPPCDAAARFPVCTHTHKKILSSAFMQVEWRYRSKLNVQHFKRELSQMDRTTT